MSLTAWRAFGKKLLSFCLAEVNCGSPITRSDDWSHKGGHKQIFRRAPRGRGWDGGRQKGEENQNHFWQKLWFCIIVEDTRWTWYFRDNSSLSVAWLSSDLTVLILKSWGTQLILRDTQWWPLLANPLLISCCTNSPQVGFNLFCSVSHQLVLTMVNFRSVPHCSRPRVWVFQLFLEPWKLSRLKYCTLQCVAEANKVQTIKVDLSWQLIHIQTQGWNSHTWQNK